MKFLEKEVMERDALNRIRWDSTLNPQEFSVLYIDRFRGKLVEVPYNSIRVEGDYIRVGDSLIPAHRVRQIKQSGRIVWAKRRE